MDLFIAGIVLLAVLAGAAVAARAVPAGRHARPSGRRSRWSAGTTSDASWSGGDGGSFGGGDSGGGGGGGCGSG